MLRLWAATNSNNVRPLTITSRDQHVGGFNDELVR